MSVIYDSTACKPGRVFSSLVLFFLILILAALACSQNDLLALGGSKPNAMIISPLNGSAFHKGEEISVQSVSIDTKGVVRVELIVDGQIVRTNALPAPLDQCILAQTWKATPGLHTIAVRSYNAQNNASDLAAISIVVSPESAPGLYPQPTTTRTPTAVSIAPTPTTALTECTDNSAFITDVTIPDGKVIPVGATVIKTWRITNTGTCSWGAGYQFVFTGGEVMTPSTVISVPSTAPGAKVDLSVPITAPNTPGSYTGNWRLQSSSGALFGVTVSVKITVPSTAPTATVSNVGGKCNGAPNIESFTASLPTIPAGGSTTLKWGPVTNADYVQIEGVGEVGTPGSASVSPGSTTTYTLIARCGGVTKTVQTTINVLPTFIVSSVSGTVDPATFSGSCAGQRNFNFSFTINASGAGTVNWILERSNRAVTAGSTTFTAGGSGEVEDTLTLGTAMYGTFWERLHVTSPNDITSNQATFTATCP